MAAYDVTGKYTMDISDLLEKVRLGDDAVDKLNQKVKEGSRNNAVSNVAQQLNGTKKALGDQIVLYQRVNAMQVSLVKEAQRYQGEVNRIKAAQDKLKGTNWTDEEIKRIKELETEIDRLTKLLDKLNDKQNNQGRNGKGQFTGSTGALLGSVKSYATDAQSELLSYAGGALAAGAAIKTTIDETAAFSKELSSLSALTGLAGKDLDFLADKAKELEDQSGISATNIVKAFKLVGGIKPELLSDKEALADMTDAVITLAQASELDLDSAARAAAGSLNQFNEGADQAARFVNVLAAGAKEGASEVNDTAEALKVSGTAMKAAGLSFEQGNALIQVLAKNMIKGSEAGTALRNVLLKLETQQDKNLRPSIVGIDTALENAAKKFDTTTERAKIFGVENEVQAGQILDNRKEVERLTKALTGTDTAYEQQRTNLNNLSTDLDRFGVAFKGFFRDLGQSEEGFLRFTIQALTSFISDLTAKKSAIQAFWSEAFSLKKENLFLPGIVQGINAYNQVQRSNEAARLAQERNKQINRDAAKQVGSNIQQGTDTLISQGIDKDDAAVKAAQAEYDRTSTALQKARAQYKKTADALAKASGEEKKRIADDSKLDALNLKLSGANEREAKKQLAQAQKDKADRAAALKRATGEPPTVEQEKEAKKAQQIEAESQRLLLAGRENYVKEYEKLQESFKKAKLEALKSDENAYLDEKARLDKEELDAEQEHIKKLLQLAASKKTAVDPNTKQRYVVADTSIDLPADIKAQFDAQKAKIDKETERQKKINKIREDADLIGLQVQTNETELKLFDLYYADLLEKAKDNKVKLLALEKKYQNDREQLILDQALRDIKANEQIAQANVQARVKGYDLSQVEFDKKNQLDDLAFQQISAERELYQYSLINDKGLDPQGKNAPEIARLNALIETIKAKRKELALLPTNRDIWDLLGISKSFKDESERAVFLNAVSAIGEAIQQASQAAIEASEARIQALDNEIAEKQKQIEIEEQRDKDGHANNLLIRKQELEDLKKQKADEEEVKRKSQRVQQTLDLATMLSSNAVAAANLFQAATEAAKQNTKLGPVIGVLAAIAGVATIITTLFAAKEKIRAMTQMRKGGRIPVNARTHEQGGHRVEGTDFELERGEHITAANLSEKYDDTLVAINKDDPKAAMRALLKEGGLGLPEMIINYIQSAPATVDGVDVRVLIPHLLNMNKRLSNIENNTKGGEAKFIPLGDGSYLKVVGNKETHIKP